MASLTPGTLHKLLQNVANKDFKVAGQHRSALLQVISILPSLEEDPWKSRGYFVRVSDSMHSAYVSVSDEDVDLILSDKIQLGQFIHVTRLDSGSPVPVLRGVKPVPKRRPCVGDPKDLISSDFLNAKKVETKAKRNGDVKKVLGNKEGGRRLSMGNGEIGGMQNRRLSLDSARRAWDRSPQSKIDGHGLKPKAIDTSCLGPLSINGGQRVKPKLRDSDSVVTNKALLNSTPSTPRISPLKSKNIIVSPKVLTKPVISPVKQTPKPSGDDVVPSSFDKVVLCPNKWSHSEFMWHSLPPTISDLGKGVRSSRNTAFISAIRALEEASVLESVIQTMSMFAELCDSSQKDSSDAVVKYLNLYDSMKSSSANINQLKNARVSKTKDSNIYSSEYINGPGTSKNASLWVQAAIEAELSRFSVYAEGENGLTGGKRRHYVVIDRAVEKTGVEIHSSGHKTNRTKHGVQNSLPKSDSMKQLSSQKEASGRKEVWSPGMGLRDAGILSEKLLSSSRAWFLDYLENSLNNRFGLKRSGDNSQILGQLKRVNKWFDDSFHGSEGANERIERLRKKLYGFLLDHVDSAASDK